MQVTSEIAAVAAHTRSALEVDQGWARSSRTRMATVVKSLAPMFSTKQRICILNITGSATFAAAQTAEKTAPDPSHLRPLPLHWQSLVRARAMNFLAHGHHDKIPRAS